MKWLVISLIFLATELTGVVCGSSSEAYTAVEVTDGATISGTVLFKGPPYKPIMYIDYHQVDSRMEKICFKDDNAQEMINGIPHFKKEIEYINIGKNNGLMNAVVVLKKIEMGKTWELSTKDYTISEKNCTFSPYVQVIPRSARQFTMVNNDPFEHTTHAFKLRDGGATTLLFHIAQPFEGAITQEVKKAREGEIVILSCAIHPWMLAWIYVVDNPYYAITDNKGQFSIINIPSGTYTVKVQHYFYPVETQEKEILITPKEKLEINFELSVREKLTE